jgi:hypothetical protein
MRQITGDNDIALMKSTTVRLRKKHNDFYNKLVSRSMLDRLPVAYDSFPKEIESEYEKVCLLLDVAHLINQADSVFLLSEAIFTAPILSVASFCRVVEICFPHDPSSSFILDTRLTLAKLMCCHAMDVLDLQMVLQTIHPDDRLELSLDSKHLFQNLSDGLIIFDSLFDAKKYNVGKHFHFVTTTQIPGNMSEGDDMIGRLTFMKAILPLIHSDDLFAAISRLAPTHRNEFKELFLRDKNTDERQSILLALKKSENSVLARSVQFNSNQLFNRDYVNQLNKRLDASAEIAVKDTTICTYKS